MKILNSSPRIKAISNTQRLKNLLQRLRDFSLQSSRPETILNLSPLSTTPLRERLLWLGQLIQWMRGPGLKVKDLIDQQSKTEIFRMRLVIQILDDNPILKKKVSTTLHSILTETQALELFMNTGIPNQSSFLSECFERFCLLLLPQAPKERDLIFVFTETLRYKNDASWIRNMDTVLFEKWIKLFQGHQVQHSKVSRQAMADNIGIENNIRNAVYLLAISIQSLGLSRLIYNRIQTGDFQQLPFFTLVGHIQKLLKAEENDEKMQAYLDVQKSIIVSWQKIDEVEEHFRQHGVSIELVYQIERLKAMLKRLEALIGFLTGTHDLEFTQEFLASLVEENYRSRGLLNLINDNIVLVCQKIIETNAEAGEHYITRDKVEHKIIFQASLGGGAITGVTTILKIIINHFILSPFNMGFICFANYASSFIGIQLMGFTLATKQPAMTATSLAQKLKVSHRKNTGPVIEEIIHLLRTQIVAVLGNIFSVVPMVMLLLFLLNLAQVPLMDEEYAQKTIKSFSILGMTPLYAAFTGILLWLSSVFSGLFANWFAFRELPLAIEHHPYLIYILGKENTDLFSKFLSKHIGGIAANISLAFFLGMTAPLASFFGLPLDVRHVTLSSGSLAAAGMTIGLSVFSKVQFWLAVGGILTMAILNLGVSFFLALSVALWAKKATAPSPQIVYRALVKKILSSPLSLLLPGKEGPNRTKSH